MSRAPSSRTSRPSAWIHLIAIGGDDTLSYAAELSRRGTPVMAVPKTMDNDVHDTEYCIGFSTAVTRAIDAIERQRTTVGSHERIGIFRVFGRDCRPHRPLHRVRDVAAMLHPRVPRQPAEAHRPPHGRQAQ